MSSITTPTHADIQSLLSSAGQYDPASIPLLEAYVRAQVLAVTSTLVSSHAPYSIDANRTLIKLYQFFPHHLAAAATTTADTDVNDADVAAPPAVVVVGVEITTLIALLSLLQYPQSTDFGCTINCLLPERIQGIEPTATIVKCYELLDLAEYANFWPEFRKLGIPEYGAAVGAVGAGGGTGTGVSSDRQLLSNAVNSPLVTNILRGNIITMLARTYRSIHVEQVLAALDIQDTASLLEFGTNIVATGKGGGGGGGSFILNKVEDADMVLFTHNGDNTKRVGNAYKEGVTYDDVAMLMSNNNKKKSSVDVCPQ